MLLDEQIVNIYKTTLNQGGREKNQGSSPYIAHCIVSATLTQKSGKRTNYHTSQPQKKTRLLSIWQVEENLTVLTLIPQKTLSSQTTELLFWATNYYSHRISSHRICSHRIRSYWAPLRIALAWAIASISSVIACWRTSKLRCTKSQDPWRSAR